MTVFEMSADGSTSCFPDQEIIACGKRLTHEELLRAWQDLHPAFEWVCCLSSGDVLWHHGNQDFQILWSSTVSQMVRRLAAMGKLPGQALR